MLWVRFTRLGLRHSTVLWVRFTRLGLWNSTYGSYCLATSPFGCCVCESGEERVVQLNGERRVI